MLLAVACGAGAQGQEQKPLDAAELADGMRLFQQKGNSRRVMAADGRKTDSQMPDGANLRDSKLDRAGLILTIKCGRLNSQMPAFDKFPYSDGRCYGKKLADLKLYPTRMPDPPATLQQREIELIADFLIVEGCRRARWITPSASNSGARKPTPVRSSRNSFSSVRPV